ncbi:unnamed protein product [Meganyctiphanes norvegica]|uniref:Tetraspanin n=1 Tax=Meganyctiphanes norvegica TaxID=48144 RepID=A0AAV2RL28_MEGNR
MLHPSNRNPSPEEGNSCFKWLLYISNIIALVAGLALVLSLMIVMVNYKEYIELLGDNATWIIALIVISVAIIMVFIAIFGCCGVSSRNTNLLIVYIVIVSTLMVGLVIGTVVAWMYQDDAIETVEENMKEKMEEYSPGDRREGGLTMVWDEVQISYECCGIKELGDWGKYNPSYSRKSTITKYPESCKRNDSDSHPFVDGCLAKIDRSIKDNVWVIGGIVFTIILYLLISLLLVSITIMSINKHRRRLYTQEQQTLLQQELQAMPYRATTVPRV